MTTITETTGLNGPMFGPLSAGLETLDLNQEIELIRYQKFILPLDGFVFWVRSGSAKVRGSLHYATDRRQLEDETTGVSRVMLTAKGDFTFFNEVGPTVIFVCTYNNMRFSFSSRAPFYAQAGVYHYVGEAVYPVFESQLIDNTAGFDDASPVVSNSLPIWLALNAAPFIYNVATTKFPLIYPSFAVPDNTLPPYIAVHVVENSTRALQSAPSFDSSLTHLQLVAERARFTLYGVRNNLALDFQDYLYQYSLDTDNFGVMSASVMVDERRPAPEITVLAQKKVFEMDISYYQERADSLARQLIESAIVTFTLAS